MDRAAVLVVLGSSNRDKNKAAYDYLFKQKARIEYALGVELDWWRFNEGKASYLNLNCHEKSIGIYNESSWDTMARFHAEWSKKLNNVIVPLLHDWNTEYQQSITHDE